MAEELVTRQKIGTRSSVRIRSDRSDSISSIHNDEHATASSVAPASSSGTIRSAPSAAVVRTARIAVPATASGAGRAAGDGAGGRGGERGGATPSTSMLIAATGSSTATVNTPNAASASSSGTQLSLVNLQAQKASDKKRNHCFWPAEEKDMFFDALNEYGKDFDAIQNVFSMRSKRKSENYLIPKTKDQIRHFYYRTWNKISKYVTEMEGISKDVLEIYGLINYGHLRKKVGSKLDSKIGNKLNTLIQYGTILITVKCKNTRIRTPLCRALKKLNNIDVEETHCKINMVPFNNRSWVKVQALSLNPRLCIKLKTDAVLSDVFSYVNSKWPIYGKDDHMILKFHLKDKLDTNPLNFKRADVRLMSNYIVNNNGQSHADEAEDETARLESQREMDEALKHLRDIQKVIDEYGGFTSTQIDNISINILRAALPSDTIMTMYYEWVSDKPREAGGGAYYDPAGDASSSSLRKLIHLATCEFIQLERHNKQVIPEILQQLDEVTSTRTRSQKTGQQIGGQRAATKVLGFNSRVSLKPTGGPRQEKPAVGTKATSKTTPMMTPKTTPKTTLKTTSKATPKATSKATPKATSKATPKATSKATSKAAKVPYQGRSYRLTAAEKSQIKVKPGKVKGGTVIASGIAPMSGKEKKTTRERITRKNNSFKDFSLSSFLYDSPVKKTTAQSAAGAAAGPSGYQPSSSAYSLMGSDSSLGRMDIEGALQSLINESSLDYASKFADLTAQFTKQNHP